jgi:hypothetical protein
MGNKLYTGIEITLEKSEDGTELSLSNMSPDQIRKLNTLLLKLIEKDKAPSDLEVSLEEGSWKIIIFSAIFSTSNLSNAIQNNLGHFSNYINSNFKEKKILSFNSVDKKNYKNRSDVQDVTDLFITSRLGRRASIDDVNVISEMEINDFNLKDEMTFTFEDKVKKMKLKNGLSLHFENLTHRQLKGITKSNWYLCTIDNNSKFSGIVGVFSNLEYYNYYYPHYCRILNKTESPTESTNLFNDISTEIIDVFEENYIKYLSKKELKEKEKDAINLHSFVSLFLNRNFDKQIHLNLLTYLSFIVPSEFTIELQNVIRNLYFQNINS